MENKKNNKGLIVLVVILSILLIGAVGYICYEKFMVKEEIVNTENENQVEKLSEEEVLKLHESLINFPDGYGFYFDTKTTIDDISAEKIVSFALGSIYTNKYKTNRFNDSIIAATIPKEEVDAYIKTHFNTDKDFTVDHIGNIHKPDLILDYDSTKKVYNLKFPQRSSARLESKTKLINYEQISESELVIYDKFVECGFEGGVYWCFPSIEEQVAPDDGFLEFFGRDDEKNPFVDKYDNPAPNALDYITLPDDDDGVFEFNYDNIFKDFNSKIPLFKHIFKKASDGKYYWYSSEIV